METRGEYKIRRYKLHKYKEYSESCSLFGEYSTTTGCAILGLAAKTEVCIQKNLILWPSTSNVGKSVWKNYKKLGYWS